MPFPSQELSHSKKACTAVFLLLAILSISVVNLAHAQSWSNHSPMKKARSESSAVSFNGQIYVFNGFGPGIRIENTVEQYNPSNGSWNIISTTSTGLGNAVTHNGIVRVGADVWVIGGRIGNHPGPVSNKVWIFNLNSRNWRPGPSLPIPGAGGGAALVNNRIHWFGGLDTQARCDVGRHLVYDLGNPGAGWRDITHVAAMPSPRNHFSTVELGGKIYAIGGQFGHDACPGKPAADTNLVHVFNPQNNQWNRLANLPIAQSHAEPSTFVHGNQIYLVGGERFGDRVYLYNPGSNNWQQVYTLPERLLAPVARIINGRLIVAGGGAPTTAVPITTMRSLAVAGAETPSVPAAPTAPEPVQEPELPENFQPFLISFEAESFSTSTDTSSHQWQGVAISGSSGSSLAALPDSGFISEQAANSPSLQYLLNFEQAGVYYVWVRGFGDTDGKSNSLHVGLNADILPSSDKLQGFTDEWRWSNATRDGHRATLQIDEAGVHNVSLWMREDGLAVDKIVISNDPRYQPEGQGPANNDGSRDDGSQTLEPVTSAGNNGNNAAAAPGISVHNGTISWPNDGWYQVLDARSFLPLCGGGSQCSVSPGEYIVINHSTGARYEGISVAAISTDGAANTADSLAGAPFTIDGNSIRFATEAWFQVQDSATLASICNGLNPCTVAAGSYVVIDHSTGQRYDDVLVGVAAIDESMANNRAMPVAGNGRITWTGGDWYQVLRLPEYESVCEGRNACDVPAGEYVVVNLTTGQRFENIRVP